MEMILTLKARNGVLFWFGVANLAAALAFVVLAKAYPVAYAGTNAWHKPIKFALSTTILVWSLGWYMGYLPFGSDLGVVNGVLVATLGFEVFYIALQAGRGMASHYNISTPYYAAMFSAMAIAATVATLAVGYVGLKFMAPLAVPLPNHYLWAIRLGIVLFVVFSFEGFAMGGRMRHTVGAPDGGGGWFFLNWSRNHGDLRIAHFIGMHALQALPLLAYHVLKNTKLTLVAALLYGMLACAVLWQALQGRPLLKA